MSRSVWKLGLGWLWLALLGIGACSLDRTPNLSDATIEVAIQTGGTLTGGVLTGGSVASGGVNPTGGTTVPQTGGCDCTMGCGDPICGASPGSNGSSCVVDGDCLSGHCGAGICCSGVDCCRSDADCGGDRVTCDSPSTCQGSRTSRTCSGFACADGDSVDDDSGCASSMTSASCGAFRDTVCDGATQQAAQPCAERCSDDSDCDALAHCAAEQCVLDVTDGGDCLDDRQCASGHCSAGVCCTSGDCCRSAGDCPGDYSSAANCESPALCQGSRMDAMCTNFVCAQGPMLEDDSACDSGVVALDCDAARDYRCNGEPVQVLPECVLACAGDADCDVGAFCGGSMSPTCSPDVADGEACERDQQCLSNHCNNGLCCASGDCCKAASDCSVGSYGRPPACVNVQTCAGLRADPVCDASFRCQQVAASISDPSGCAGQVARSCGNFSDVLCDGTAQQALDCMFSCAGPQDCDPGLSCVNGSCG